LRDRAAEIAPLARAFLDEAGPRFGRSEPLAIAPDVLDALARYRWPGNLRELRNVIERAVVLCDGAMLRREHLPAKLVDGDAPGERCVLDARAHERRRILDALALCGGNQSRAAKMLGVSRRTLVSRLDAYDIARPLKQH
jgi:two-component system, NtrC family, response regulator AtoC